MFNDMGEVELKLVWRYGTGADNTDGQIKGLSQSS